MIGRRVPVAYAALLLSLGTLALYGAEAAELKRQGDHIDVLVEGKAFTTYYFAPDSPKPYLHPLRSAQGTVVTRGWPMVKDIPGESTDHPHHRAMFFAHGDINGIDFWGEARFEEKAPVHVAGKTYTSEDLPKGRTIFANLAAMESGGHSGNVRANFNLV